MLASSITIRPELESENTAPQRQRIDVSPSRHIFLRISSHEDGSPHVDLIDLSDSESFQTMLASEAVLRKDWDTPEEDNAWAYL